MMPPEAPMTRRFDFRRELSRVVAGLTLLTGCVTAGPGALGQSMALQDDAGVVVVTWDTKTARVYRDGRETTSFDATSFDAALWNVSLPAYGAPRAMHRYQRRLTDGEIQRLSTCSWTEARGVTDCGLDAACDCGDASSSVLLAHLW